jgi:hypothetical protein
MSGRTDSIARYSFPAQLTLPTTVGHIGPDELGFGEVVEPGNALHVEVPLRLRYCPHCWYFDRRIAVISYRR